MDAILFRPEMSLRRALMLALGTHGTEGLFLREREPIIGKRLDLYENDPDAGRVHLTPRPLKRGEEGDSL
jgi:hypothetical protein